MKRTKFGVPLLRKWVNRTGVIVACAFTATAVLQSPVIGQVNQEDLTSAIESINKIEANGVGHEKAIGAIKILNSASAEQVPTLLSGLDGGNKLAQNWIRGAIQSALGGATSMPTDAIRAFLDNGTGGDMGRLMAYELLVEHSPELSDKLLPEYIDDRCLPLRELSIAWHIASAEKADKPDAVYQLAHTLPHARKVEQVQDIAKRLAEQGVHVDLQKQLGFINEWKLVGPFDNRNKEGFARATGPETDIANIDLEATYSDSLDGSPVKWTNWRTLEPTGIVNLIDLFGKTKGASVYGYAEFEATDDMECELRIGCINASRVWLNGQEIMSNEIYHVGMMPDQFSGTGKLVKGTNKILVKICQNEQEEPWAQDWMFQLRICNPDGSAIRPAPPASPEQ